MAEGIIRLLYTIALILIALGVALRLGARRHDHDPCADAAAGDHLARHAAIQAPCAADTQSDTQNAGPDAALRLWRSGRCDRDWFGMLVTAVWPSWGRDATA